jgi:hypothetical protein
VSKSGKCPVANAYNACVAIKALTPFNPLAVFTHIRKSPRGNGGWLLKTTAYENSFYIGVGHGGTNGLI